MGWWWNCGWSTYDDEVVVAKGCTNVILIRNTLINTLPAKVSQLSGHVIPMHVSCRSLRTLSRCTMYHLLYAVYGHDYIYEGPL